MRNIKAIDKYLGVADKKMALLSRLNPTNAGSEKQKFLCAHAKGRVYNPVFKYRPIKIDLVKLYDDLKSFAIIIPEKRDEQWFFSKHLANKRRRILRKIKCLKSRGSSTIFRHSLELFGCPSTSQLEYAKNQFTLSSCSAFSTIQDTLSDIEAAKILQTHAESSNLPWRVKLRKNMSSKAGLDSRFKYLLVKSGEQFAPEEVASLTVHEIETHIFRKENGLLQHLPYLFGEGFAGPPTTEEGLAFYNETLSEHDPRRMLLVSARTMAAHLARRRSFYEVFCRLVKLGLPLPYAWNVTLRVKRGISDTSQPGAFTKDHHYLKGYLDVKKYIEDGGDARLLYAGKLNIANAKSLVEFGVETREPKYLPKYFH